jgi:hypothetical protein
MKRADAAAEEPIEHTLCLIETGIVGICATFAAVELGLTPLHALLAIFFTTALTGQFLVSLLRRR